MKQALALIGLVVLSVAHPVRAAEHTEPTALRPSPNRIAMTLTDVDAAQAIVKRTDISASDVPSAPIARARVATPSSPGVSLRTPLQTAHPLPASPTTPLGFRRADFAWAGGPQIDTRGDLSRNAHDASAGISTCVIK
jgi:hypothetical protein